MSVWDRWGWVGLLVLLLGLVGLTYSQVMTLDFLTWDDPKMVSENPVVRKGLHWEGVVWAFSQQHPFVMPLVFLSLMLDVTVTQNADAMVFHGGNLLIYLVNTGLVFVFARMLLGGVWGPLTVAGLMGLHPQHVEAVVWITERKELLSFLAGMLALLAYVHFVRRLAADRRDAASRLLWLAVFLFLMSLLCKPQWVTLPFLLLLLDHWPLGRHGVGWRALVLEKWPFFLLTGLYVAWTVGIYQSRELFVGLAAISLEERLVNGVLALAGQLGKTFWPVDLAVLYPTWAKTAAMGEVVLQGGVLLAMTLGVWVWRHGHPHLVFGWLWFLGALFPSLGLINSGVVVGMSDRWSYHPHLGLFLAIGAVVAGGWRRWPILLVAGLVTVLLLAGMQSRHQIAYWRDEETLWRHALVATAAWPNPHAHWMLGAHYRGQGRLAEAIRELETANRQRPDDPFYIQSLAQLYLRTGENERGMQLLLRLLTLPSTPRDMLVMQGSSMVLDRNFSNGILFLAKAVAQPPVRFDQNVADGLFYLSLAFSGLNRLEEGEAFLLAFLDMAPGRRERHCDLVRHAMIDMGPHYPEFLGLQGAVSRLCASPGA